MPTDRFEQQFELFRVLTSADYRSACARLAEQNASEWEEWAEFLSEHRLREYFLSMMREANQLDLIPKTLCRKLVRQCEWSRGKTSRLAELQRDAEAVFRDRNIECIVLKGETITQRFYPAGFQRHQGDVDLLVRESEVSAAVRALQSIGGQLRGGKREFARGKLQTEHALSLKRDDVSLDLHWQLRPGPSYAISMEQAWETRRPISPTDPTRVTLSDEYLLVLMLTSLAGDIGRGGLRLKSLFDIQLVTDRLAEQLDTEEFWERRRSEGIDRVCRHALAVVDEVFQRPARNPSLNFREALAVQKTCRLSRRLIAAPRNAVENFLWLAGIHRLWKPGHLAWFARKSVPHLGRLPNAIMRVVKFGFYYANWRLRGDCKLPPPRTSALVESKSHSPKAA